MYYTISIRVKSESAAVCQRWREVMAHGQSSDLTTRTPVKRKVGPSSEGEMGVSVCLVDTHSFSIT